MPLQIEREIRPVQQIDDPYPAIAKQAAAVIDGIITDATSTLFTDKILITVTQDGRLAQWVCTVPVIASCFDLI